MKNLPTQTEDRGGKPKFFRKDPSNLSSRRVLSKNRMRAIHRKQLYLLLQIRYKQYNEENFIVHGRSETNVRLHLAIKKNCNYFAYALQPFLFTLKPLKLLSFIELMVGRSRNCKIY